jgi:hypothetical protein
MAPSLTRRLQTITEKTPAAEKLFAHGNIQIFLSKIGWIWCIPMTQGRLSVGLVVQKEVSGD